jgi:hypothetical protein
MEVLVASAAKGDKVLQPFLCIGFIRPVVNVLLNAIASTKAAAIAVSTMYLFLEDRPLFRLPTLRVGPPAIVGKKGLLAKIVQAALLFGVLGPLHRTRLAEKISKVVAAHTPTKSPEAVMHPQ